MKLTDNYLIQKDVERLAQEDWIPWERLAGKSLLVTGATGLIGYQIVLSALAAGERLNSPIHVFAVVRNEQKAGRMFLNAPKENLTFVVQDITCFYVDG